MLKNCLSFAIIRVAIDLMTQCTSNYTKQQVATQTCICISDSTLVFVVNTVSKPAGWCWFTHG